jgi:hydrogenase nickel incorporation protein HypA/HybF
MHELSVSREIAKVVLDKARREGAREVLRIEIEIGALSFLNPEQVEFWTRACLEGSIAEKAEIGIDIIEPQVVCRGCGYKGGLKIEEDPLYHIFLPSLSCPSCGGVELDIEKGRECVIRRMELLV